MSEPEVEYDHESKVEDGIPLSHKTHAYVILPNGLKMRVRVRMMANKNVLINC